jgi:hypothetical protein
LLMFFPMSTTIVVRDMSIGLTSIAHRYTASLSLGHAVASPRMSVFSTVQITCKRT